MEFNLSADIIDMRDLLDRWEELKGERETLADNVGECEGAYEFHDSDDTRTTQEYADMLDARKALADWDESEEAKELETLDAIVEELRGYGGDEQRDGSWFPLTLIRDSYFTEAMQDMVQDIGDLPRDIPRYLVIDWEATAENLKVDYSTVEIEGTTYFYR